MDIEMLPEQHLINILKSTREHHPNYVLFLGAGASVASGIETSQDLVNRWRKEYRDMYGPGKDSEEFLENQSWYKKENEYSELFERLYHHPSQRREVVESCVENAHPSWGYIYLINLMMNGTFNTVFTTNFDDLINEACYLYSSDLRPHVCAHDSSIQSVRVTTRRPKIIKLHGDYLFDDIKNTLHELESLERNMKEKFQQYAREFGMIVVGYAGADRTVMDTLDTLLRMGEHFPHGIYWCIRRGDEKRISARLQTLLRFDRVKLVRIDGFDEFFASLHHGLELRLQKEMVDPYSALTDRLNALVESAPSLEGFRKNRLIAQDIDNLSRHISRLDSARNGERDGVPRRRTIEAPHRFLARMKLAQNEIDKAKHHILEDLNSNPEFHSVIFAIRISTKACDDDFDQQLWECFRRMRDLIISQWRIMMNDALKLINARRFKLAQDLYRMVWEETGDRLALLNYVQCYKHSQKSIPDELISEVKKVAASEENLERMGALILLEEYEEASVLKEQLKAEHLLPSDADEWPIFKLIPLNEKRQELEMN